MEVLNLFPSRASFVDGQGRLTPEASRALQVVVRRMGGVISGEVESITVGPSPFSYTADTYGTVAISGGNVTPFVQIARGSSTVDTGQIDGLFPMNQGDVLTVSYTEAPTMKFIPR